MQNTWALHFLYQPIIPLTSKNLLKCAPSSESSATSKGIFSFLFWTSYELFNNLDLPTISLLRGFGDRLLSANCLLMKINASSRIHYPGNWNPPLSNAKTLNIALQLFAALIPFTLSSYCHLWKYYLQSPTLTRFEVSKLSSNTGLYGQFKNCSQNFDFP